MSERTEQEEPIQPHEAGVPLDVAPPAGEPADEPAPDGAARPSVAPRTMGWRDQTVGTALITFAVGIWLMLSPEALGYGTGDAILNPVVCGVLIAVFSAGRLVTSWRAFPLGVILFVLGAWLCVSAFLFEAPPGGQLNQAGFGGIVALLSMIGIAGSQRGRELNPMD